MTVVTTPADEHDAIGWQWSRDQQRLLELMARGAPMRAVLDELCLAIERIVPGCFCSVLQLDAQGRLWTLAAPNIGAAFTSAIDGSRIGPMAGSCGTAAYFKRAVLVRDIATDPLWREWKTPAIAAGFRCCWSTPIVGSRDDVLGTFALYSRERKDPTSQLLRLAGEATHLASIALERERIELALRAGEMRLREITDTIGEVFYSASVDANGGIAALDYVSPSVATVWGLDLATFASAPTAWLDIIHADDRPLVDRALAERARRGEFDMEYRILHPSGGTRWIHDRNVPVRDSRGRIVRWVGSAVDITARKLAEQQLAERELLLERIIESAMDAIICVDVSGTIVLFNRTAETIFRIASSEVLGTSIDRFIDAPLREVHRAHMATFAKTGASARTMAHPAQVYGVRADGERFPLEATIARAEVNGRTLLTVILRDLAERTQLETQVRQSQRMDAMGRLAGGIAHDFNNLLTAIRASAELLISDLGESPLRNDAHDILTTADRAASLTRQLLAFSRTQVLRRDIVDLNRVAAGIETLLRRVMSESIALTVETSSTPALVLADATQLEQILVNLIINARDAMPGGGRVLVRTMVCAPADLPPSITRRASMDEAGRVVLLTIVDTGTGMSEETRARAFEPFFTTKEPGRGTGLGLATVYGIVEQSRGAVAIESALGNGTTVHVALPAAPESRTATPARAFPVEPLLGRGTVLLVEDEPAVRSIARRVLTRAGYTILEATNGKDALGIWHTHRNAGTDTPAIDLVITDMVMPERSGRDLARELRDDKPDLPVLFMSGYLEGGLTESERGPHTAFLEKPFTSQGLLVAVKEMLGARG